MMNSKTLLCVSLVCLTLSWSSTQSSISPQLSSTSSNTGSAKLLQQDEEAAVKSTAEARAAARTGEFLDEVYKEIGIIEDVPCSNTGYIIDVTPNWRHAIEITTLVVLILLTFAPCLCFL